MAKNSISDYDTTAANNTDIGNIDIQGGAPPRNFDNALRELMSHLKTEQTSKNTDITGLRALPAFNWVFNGDFTVNQRGASTKAQTAGTYGYDMWKGHASGLEQVIEALPAGEYTLSWTGGGNGTFNGTTAASPIKETVTAGNTSVIVPSTATKVSLLLGDATNETTTFIARPYGLELALCSRYYWKFETYNVSTDLQIISFPKMRATPTATVSNGSAGALYADSLLLNAAGSNGTTEIKLDASI